jgi:hypothetical protein
MMTKLERLTEARDQLERVLRGLRADLRHAATLRDADLCKRLRAEHREIERSWLAMCRDVAELKHEAARSTHGRARKTIFTIG